MFKATAYKLYLMITPINFWTQHVEQWYILYAPKFHSLTDR